MNPVKHLDGIRPSPLVEAALVHGRGGSALHLGAGSGRNALFLAANGYRVTAVDSSQSQLEVLAFAAAQAGLPVGVLAADTSGFKPESTYDLVVASAFVTMFDRESITETIRMVQSLTNPGGLNVLLVSADKDATGERPRLFEAGILPGYYEGWQVLHEEEQLADIADDVRQHHRAGLVARRP